MIGLAQFVMALEHAGWVRWCGDRECLTCQDAIDLVWRRIR